MIKLKSVRPLLFFMAILLIGIRTGWGEEADERLELPVLVIREITTSDPMSGGTYAAPVSSLRFQPDIDLQSRNIPEAQADLTIRGGIFSETGVELGAATLVDPQTAHYTSEIPIPPAMISSSRILTGVDNNLFGFNSMAGTIGYAWLPIETVTAILGGLGDHRLNLQHLYSAYLISPHEEKNGIFNRIGFDIDLAHSESDGTRQFGDYDFDRLAGRIQFRGSHYQSDIFCGYQSKFFGWPNMYTPADFLETDETESLHTTLILFNHRVEYSRNDHLEITGYYRNNSDHYILQRSDPEIYQAFHQSRVWSLGINGNHEFKIFQLDYSGQISVDNLSSTTLVYCPYYSRTIGKLALLPGRVVEIDPGLNLAINCGAAVDGSNRFGSYVSPLARLALVRQGGEEEENRYYWSYGGSSQLPSYTALGSPPEGLFGGNPDLGREKSSNLEMGIDLIRKSWNFHGALFYRINDDLVDWTYEETSPNARTAAAVDIKCWGTELILNKKWNDIYLSVGYAFLKKHNDYHNAEVEASFYALNFPRHRLTVNLNFNFLEIFEFRSGNEYRVQEENALRTGRDDACLNYFEVICRPRILEGLKISGSVDNPFKVNFQEVPGVPGPGRQFTLSAAYSW